VRIQLHQYFHFGFLAARQPFSKILSTLLADRLGVKMMAEAGYHPDFILALFDPFKSGTGDRSKQLDVLA
jgi:predicted Zn-dependent protease